MGIGSSLLNRISSSSWYIKPACLQAMQNILELKFINNLKVSDINAIVNLVDREQEEITPFYVAGNKLIINISGTLVPKGNSLDALCGFIGMDSIAKIITDAQTDSRFNHIILVWDSPGGTVAGSVALSNLIYQTRKFKQVTSLIAGEMCSAAYFIGSAADEIYAEELTSIVGSIGVYMLHVDQSEYDKDRGLKFTYIAAGEFKTLGNEHEPLNLKAVAALQEIVDYDYKVFLETVARNRNLIIDQVKVFAEGKVFQAGRAPEGMIDGIKTLKSILEE